MKARVSRDLVTLYCLLVTNMGKISSRMVFIYIGVIIIENIIFCLWFSGKEVTPHLEDRTADAPPLRYIPDYISIVFQTTHPYLRMFLVKFGKKSQE